MILYGQSRELNNPGILLEKGQEAFFILRGVMFPDLKLDPRIIVKIKVGDIQRNEKGEKQKIEAISPE